MGGDIPGQSTGLRGSTASDVESALLHPVLLSSVVPDAAGSQGLSGPTEASIRANEEALRNRDPMAMRLAAAGPNVEWGNVLNKQLNTDKKTAQFADKERPEGVDDQQSAPGEVVASNPVVEGSPVRRQCQWNYRWYTYDEVVVFCRNKEEEEKFGIEDQQWNEEFETRVRTKAEEMWNDMVETRETEGDAPWLYNYDESARARSGYGWWSDKGWHDAEVWESETWSTTAEVNATRVPVEWRSEVRGWRKGNDGDNEYDARTHGDRNDDGEADPDAPEPWPDQLERFMAEEKLDDRCKATVLKANVKVQRDFVSLGSFVGVDNPSAVAGRRLADLRSNKKWPLDSYIYTLCAWCGNGVKIEKYPRCSRCRRTPKQSQ